MFIADVGADTTEELNLGVAGANYGFPLCEGSCGTAGLTNPILTYQHNSRDASIIGGFVYRNGTLLATRDVTAWPPYSRTGYVGLWLEGASSAFLDDFGGGTIAP